MIGFTGIIDLNASELKKDIKDKLIKNFSTHSFSSFSINVSNDLAICYTNDACSIFQDHDSKYLSFVYGNIENRDELIQTLGFNENAENAEIILLAMKFYGEDFCQYIKGAFVAFILNRETRRFIAFKDHIGQRPFFYFLKNSKLIFSTEISQIVDLNIVQKKINKNRVIYFLTYLCGPEGETFFKDIFRLPARKKLLIDQGCAKLSEYYFFKLYEKNIHEKEYIQTLGNALEKNIIFNADDNNLASKLSGGLDSSSISAYLIKNFNPQAINFYSGVFNLNIESLDRVNEYQYIKSFEEFHSVKSNYVEFNDIEDLNPFKFSENDYEPNFIMSRYFDNRFLKEVKKRNITKLFDGFDGDSVISYGTNRLQDLGKAWKILELFREKKLMEKNGFIQKGRNLKFFIRFFIKPNLPNSIIKFTKFLRGQKKSQEMNYANLSNKTKSNYKIKKISNDVGDFDDGYIGSQQVHKKVLEWPLWEYILDITHSDSVKHGIEEIYPFLSRDVMEIALNAPSRLKLKEGKTRYILRQALKNDLPSKITNRSNKSDLSPPIDQYFTDMKEKKMYLDLLIGKDSALKGLIDEERIIKMYKIDNKKDNQFLTCVISLAIWMQKFSFKWE